MSLSFNSLVFVTGCPRSGASMTARILYMCGAFGGTFGKARSGFGRFRNDVVSDWIVTPYFKALSADTTGQYPLPKEFDLIPAPLLKSIFEFELTRQGCSEGRTLFYKDTRLCLIWKIWKEAFPGARWIIVRRSDQDIVRSCMKTDYMNAYQNAGDWLNWVSSYRERFKQMKEAGLDVVEIWPTEYIEGDFSGIKRVVANLGLVWNEDAVSGIISSGKAKDLKGIGGLKDGQSY